MSVMAADANSVSTTALVLLAVLPITAGAVLTALFAWLAQRRIDRREHARWLRERRFESYRALFRTSGEVRTAAVNAIGFATTKVPWEKAGPILDEFWGAFELAYQDACLIANTYAGGKADETLFTDVSTKLGGYVGAIEQGHRVREYELGEVDEAIFRARHVMAMRFADEPRLSLTRDQRRAVAVELDDLATEDARLEAEEKAMYGNGVVDDDVVGIGEWVGGEEEAGDDEAEPTEPPTPSR